jgi:hypothetical protein
MIGNIQPYLSAPHLRASFMKPYCSLCSSLRKQYDLPTSLLLNYELSFVLLGLDQYVQGDEIKTPCPSSAFLKKRDAYTHPAADKAAQLSIILGWIKSMDFLADEKKKITLKRLMKIAEKKLGKRSASILSELSLQTQQAIRDYAELTNNSTENIQNIRKKTYALSSQVCYEVAVMTEMPAEERAVYMDFFGKLGVGIALLDPLVDIEKDLESGVYNPIVDAYEHEGNELKQHYIQFFEAYKSAYFDLQTQLKQEHKFSAQFSKILSSSLENSFTKIRKTTDNLFGGIEDKILDGMMVCAKTCETKTQGRTLSFLGLLIPLDSCGNGCKGPDCGHACKPPSNCGQGCGNGCKGGDCGGGDCGGGNGC